MTETAPKVSRRANQDSEPLLSLRGLSVSYGNIAAVQGIDLEVHEGEIVTLIGSNGAGASR